MDMPNSDKVSPVQVPCDDSKAHHEEEEHSHDALLPVHLRKIRAHQGHQRIPIVIDHAYDAERPEVLAPVASDPVVQGYLWGVAAV